jgi:stearoyl-CoA desaturase (delta-9 desaturase)
LAPSPTTAVIFATFFAVTALGIGVGLHRYFTHRAFEATRPVQWALAIFGSWAIQGPITRWVADHRRHHRFTDSPLDPHSPYWDRGQPIRSPLIGLLHAHVLWMLTGHLSDERIYAGDVERDAVAGWCSRHYWALCASSLVAPALVGFAVAGPHEGLCALMWAGCLRVTVLHHITWSVNSFGHMFGTKVAGSRDESRDNLALAVLLMGEGLHSYHHRFPAAAVNAPQFLDFNGLVIRLLEGLGLIWGLKWGRGHPNQAAPDEPGGR